MEIDISFSFTFLGFLENDDVGFISLRDSSHVVGACGSPCAFRCSAADSAIDRFSKQIDWSSPSGDLVRRAFWHCAILETGLHLELDLPLSGLLQLSVDSVAFQHPSSEDDDIANEVTNFRSHYSSQLTLRRLCAAVHDRINECMLNLSGHPVGGMWTDDWLAMGTSNDSKTDVFNGPSPETLDELALRLQRWRSYLPSQLQWPEDDPTVWPQEVDQRLRYQQNLDPALAFSPKLFSLPSQQSLPSVLPYVYDIQVALLRTRYYYAKYMVYRPYIYKALHFPDQVTDKDAQAIAICLKVC